MVVEEILQFTGRHLAIRLDDNERTRTAELEFIQLGQYLYVLTCNFVNRREDSRDAIDQRLIDFWLRDFLGVTFNLEREVFYFFNRRSAALRGGDTTPIRAGVAMPELRF